MALIGHSRGGHYARALAARRPDRVSHAISMGAAFKACLEPARPPCSRSVSHGALSTPRDEPRKETCLTGHCGCPFSHDYARPFPFEHVRLTSFYSKSDGVVRWPCQVIPYADCIEVTGSHIGLVFNRKSYRALALPELPTD